MTALHAILTCFTANDWYYSHRITMFGCVFLCVSVGGWRIVLFLYIKYVQVFKADAYTHIHTQVSAIISIEFTKWCGSFQIYFGGVFIFLFVIFPFLFAYHLGSKPIHQFRPVWHKEGIEYCDNHGDLLKTRPLTIFASFKNPFTKS